MVHHRPGRARGPGPTAIAFLEAIIAWIAFLEAIVA